MKLPAGTSAEFSQVNTGDEGLPDLSTLTLGQLRQLQQGSTVLDAVIRRLMRDIHPDIQVDSSAFNSAI